MKRLAKKSIKSPYLASITMSAEPKTVSLLIGERLAAMKIFDTFKGSLDTLAVILEDIKQFTVTEEEWKAANLVKTPGKDGTETWNWDDTTTKDITIQEASLKFLADSIKQKSEAGEVTLSDVSLLGLKSKLESK